MAIAPGDDITGTPEPLPRDSLTNRLGGLARGWINYFQGKDRLTGEILSGVNRNRQNIVQLQTDYTAADGAVSSAYITADAVVAADASGARATLSTTLVAAYEAADSAIQGQVTTNAASIVTEQSVRASGDAANASSITTLEAAYEAADSAIQGQVTTNAASIVTEESARASGDSANASSITTLEAQVATNEAHVQQIAEAYATDSSATARLVWTVNTTTNAATIEQTAAEGYVDGTWNGSAINLAADQITLLAEDINFGSQTAFDTATETFITEVGSIRSRYGTAFGASSDLIRWDGPVAVTQGSETPTNGYLAITTSGAIYKDDAALGWGATAAEAAASNAQVGTGANSLVDTGFRQPGSDYWQIYDNSAGSLGFSVLDYDSGIRVGQAVGAGFTAGQFIVVYAGVKNKLSVKPGDAVGFRCLVGGASLSSIRLRIVFQDDAGAVVSVPESTPRTTGILTGAGEADFFTEESLVAVAPALATRARVDVLGYVSGASPRVRLAFPTMAILQTGQTVAPPLQRGFDAVPGADPTIDNTAAAFTGQGALATLDQATWATQITGTGKPSDFANVSRVFRSSTAPVEPNLNDLWVVLAGGVPIAVRAWDGSSWITGADLTSLNTAAAIAGQGWGATAAEAAASNAQVAIGANAIGNSEFYAGVDGWSKSAGSGNTGALSLRAAGTSWATPYRGTLMVYQPDAGATGYTDIRWRPQRNGVTGFPLKVQPGDKVAMRANVSAHRCLIRSYIQWRDAAGLVLSYTVGPTNNAILSSSTEPDVWPLLSVVGTAPASAAWAEIMFRKEATSSGANSYMFLHKPMLALLAPGSVVVPQYAPGVPLDIYGGADVTGDNTAGSVVGQGALATLNQVGTSNLSASAVTDTAADSTDAAASLANNTWTTVATVSVTAASGADLLITGSAFHLASYSGAGSYTGSIACDLRLRRDSTVLRTQDATTNVLIAGGPGSILSTTRGPSTIQDVDLSVSAGTYSYTLQANIDLKQVGGSGLVRNISNRLLIVTQLKR